MMKLKYTGKDNTCLIPGRIYECSVSIEDYCIYLICDAKTCYYTGIGNFTDERNTCVGRLYTNVESFLKNWEWVSNL